jgi:hypothetical protein
LLVAFYSFITKITYGLLLASRWQQIPLSEGKTRLIKGTEITKKYDFKPSSTIPTDLEAATRTVKGQIKL